MIEALEQLIDRYHPLGIVKAEELLLHPEDAVSLANELEKKGILILGVDFWYYIDNKIVENPSSLDLSEIKNVKTSARLVEEFITNQLPEKTAFVSFVLEEDRIFEGSKSEIMSNLQWKSAKVLSKQKPLLTAKTWQERTDDLIYREVIESIHASNRDIITYYLLPIFKTDVSIRSTASVLNCDSIRFTIKDSTIWPITIGELSLSLNSRQLLRGDERENTIW